MKKRIIILGCTGSIGTTAAEIVRELPDVFEIAGLSAQKNARGLLRIACEFSVEETALTGSEKQLTGIKYHGSSGLLEMIRNVDADMVLNGITGSSGLQYSIAALESGKDVALANKESVIMAGGLLFSLARKKGKTIVPVDSEHSAVFQLMRHRPAETLSRIILTASGGPFLKLPQKDFASVTPLMAVRHPTWQMGEKISIDSATLANKGLEIIETQQFFNVKPEQISVIIHPQSLVHSMIETKEGSLYAQISQTSMKLPILNALSYPKIVDYQFEQFSLVGKTLTFHEPDFSKFPMLKYAFEVIQRDAAYPIVYNAANEIAVEAYLQKDMLFTDIPKVVYDVISMDWLHRIDSFEAVYEIDAKARKAGWEKVRSL